MYVIGIDIGTTSICGVVLDTDTGKAVKSRTELSNAFIQTPNSWEKIQNTDRLISIACAILDDFLREFTVCAIGLTGQMHGIVYVNAEGKAISPLYTWQDGRGNQPYKDTTYAKFLGSNTGYGNVTDFYNRENGLRPADAVSHCTIMDYLAMYLCGLKKPVIHSTNAASLGCFDLSGNAFFYDLDAAVSDTFQIAGEYKGIPVSLAIGDNQASVFSTLTNADDLLINVGTGSQVSLISDLIRTGQDIESRPYFDGKYLVVGAALCGGRAYGILKDFYKSFMEAAGASADDVYGVMGKLIQDTAASYSPLTVNTRFSGTRQNPALTGSITEITAENFTPANLTLGVLEGMMAELYEMYAQMGEKRLNLVGSGNGIRLNPVLVQIAERTFGGTLKIPAHTEEAAYGAALFALVACGAAKDADDAQKLVCYQ